MLQTAGRVGQGEEGPVESLVHLKEGGKYQSGHVELAHFLLFPREKSPDDTGNPLMATDREIECVCVCVLVSQSCPTLCDPKDCSAPGSSDRKSVV